ncbi:hypothetical protein TNCV_1969621 [Trichonephila clavipes]|nr:hypothetical protein TNCV_1969621 [Trichonephila clavipes]
MECPTDIHPEAQLAQENTTQKSVDYPDHLILQNQYSEQPPLAITTALIHLGIESNSDWMACTDTGYHAASTRCHS